MYSKAPLPSFRIKERLKLINIGFFKWDIPTHLTSYELFRIYDLVKNESNVKIVVEVGSYLGASCLFMASALGRRNGRIYCVDTWKNDAMSEGSWDTFNFFLNNTKKFSSKITPLRGDSSKIALDFDSKIDLLFLDGDHSYAGVKSDFDAWFPKLSKGGIILMHDVGWAEGVQRVLKENLIGEISKSECLPNLFLGWKK